MQYNTRKERLSILLKSLEKKKRILILAHNNPDPDSLASSLAFRALIRGTMGKRADIYCGGLIGRVSLVGLDRI